MRPVVLLLLCSLFAFRICNPIEMLCLLAAIKLSKIATQIERFHESNSIDDNKLTAL